jgi:chemotaxis protein methyltransferase CheR
MESGTNVRSPAWTLLRDLIAEHIGVSFDQNNLDLMVNKISDLMAELDLDSPLDYYYLLKYEGSAGEEWSKLQNAVSVRETYFGREIDQILAFVEVLVPRLVEQSLLPLRIWSAACATGEEPLSIAMALDQTGWLGRVPLEICASDMSSAALCTARRGIYRERSFRNFSPELHRRYFRRVAEGWEVDLRLRQHISWHRVNLTSAPEIEQLARSRVIFCRNVFIYFSESGIRRVVKTFEDQMPRPGYLFVGAAESLLKFTSEFQLQQINGAFVYVKE